jgi:hypothetical protein
MSKKGIGPLATAAKDVAGVAMKPLLKPGFHRGIRFLFFYRYDTRQADNGVGRR